MSKRALIDMSPLKAGGGCQLAINFLLSAVEDPWYVENCRFLLPDVGPLADFAATTSAIVFHVAPSSSLLRRVLHERFEMPKLIAREDIGVVYTFFGSGLRRAPGVAAVASTAYPIICYPESPYWSNLSKRNRIKQKLKNVVRRARLRAQDLIVVETLTMRNRVSKALRISTDRFLVAAPAASRFVTSREPSAIQGPYKSLLFLSGVARHKNLWRLPGIVQHLSTFTQEFTLRATVTRDDFVRHLSNAEREVFAEVEHFFDFLGPVAPAEIDAVYDTADILVSLSDLESYSNNYMEAWKAAVDLVVSDRDFSREICGDSALYLEPHDPVASANTIYSAITGEGRLIRLADGKQRLAQLPTDIERRAQIRDWITPFMS